ncbi:hypothetical protein AVEN_275139-1 [Araneus ventricosus]|uniref:Uncharacterized protein n=1 Tax=Araneus ventricosus TaxID=182803 RepID=A0A4Y2MGM4_ARAVE|nr:hypothetical protein AVEN_275139-1 [Araneus ventricosus]
MEYAEVIPTDKIINNLIREKVLEKIAVSTIGSSERNPDIKGTPINDREEIPNIEAAIGMWSGVDAESEISLLAAGFQDIRDETSGKVPRIWC